LSSFERESFVRAGWNEDLEATGAHHAEEKSREGKKKVGIKMLEAWMELG